MLPLEVFGGRHIPHSHGAIQCRSQKKLGPDQARMVQATSKPMNSWQLQGPSKGCRLEAPAHH